jgi:transcriptional regulator with XRE-family HTH domain/SAM-dependent methyltransferase
MDNQSLSFTTSAIGKKVAHLRRKRGLTLAGLAELSSVSKASISAIENGKNNPTIDTLWNIAVALGVEFGGLVGPDLDKTVFNEDGMNVRLIDRQFNDRHIEVYMLELPPDTCRQAQAHPAGVQEHILVIAGELTTGPEVEPVLIRAGQYTQFFADQPHLYRARSQSCRAIVTIIYPLNEINLTEFDQILPWPHDTSDEDWQVVYDLLSRARTEVHNGRLLTRLTFRNTPKAGELPLTTLRKKIATSHSPNDSARVYVCSHPAPAFVTLYRTMQMRQLPRANHLRGELLETCRTLADMALDPVLSLEPNDTPKLEQQTTSVANAIIESVLAAEVLTRSGKPAVPALACGNRAIQANDEVVGGERLFEHRIDVDAYNAYELIHPAYARQVLATAELLPSLLEGNKEKPRLLDIGSGPGLPLQMLLELRPEFLVTAVDPSETAYRHFTARFANDSRVSGIKASITEYRPEETLFDAAISIGASHHLDSVDFLKSTRACLKPRASLVICDEMIVPFKGLQERVRNLITHHLWYILDTLVSLPSEADQADRDLSCLLNNMLPSVMAQAMAGRVSDAQQLLRETYEAACEIKIADIISVPVAAFPRFHMLELQALVAGLDYEVEQKTSANRFIALAEAHGFNLREHHRIYATTGDDPFDAGTHIYLFEARS